VGTAHADGGSGISWDAIAQCESGNRWNINTGNGFLGGLQWNISTYHANGGVGNPANASREAQIAVAERIIATQGVARGLANWPVCGKRAWSGAPSKVTAPKVTAHVRQQTPTSGATCVVRSGDTLARIAADRNLTGGWSALYQANRGVLSDPNTIYPGETLRLP
jgi:LysM repeat protein